jgi:hypothetical protein
MLGERARLAPARPTTLRSTTEFSLNRYFKDMHRLYTCKEKDATQLAARTTTTQ